MQAHSVVLVLVVVALLGSCAHAEPFKKEFKDRHIVDTCEDLSRSKTPDGFGTILPGLKASSFEDTENNADHGPVCRADGKKMKTKDPVPVIQCKYDDETSAWTTEKDDLEDQTVYVCTKLVGKKPKSGKEDKRKHMIFHLVHEALTLSRFKSLRHDGSSPLLRANK